MPYKLKAIPDPEKKGGKTVEIPKSVELKKLVVKKKIDSKIDAKAKGPEVIPKKLDTLKVSERVSTAVKEVKSNAKYYIGKEGHAYDCGPVLEVIPYGGFKNISTGGTTLEKTFTTKKQLNISTSTQKGKDYLLVVGAEGCVLVSAKSTAHLNMPVFVVEPTGEYYHLNEGQREVHLGPGGHIVLYTTTASILYVRVDTKEPIAHKSAPVVAKKPETKAASKTDSKTGSKTDSKSESKSSSKEAPKTPPKPVSKPQPKPEPKPQPKPEAKPKPEVKPQPKPEPKPEPKPKAAPPPPPPPPSPPKVEVTEVVVAKTAVAKPENNNNNGTEEISGEVPSKWKAMMGMAFFVALIIISFLIYFFLIRRQRRTHCRICGKQLPKSHSQ